jgi:hypothetical protein
MGFTYDELSTFGRLRKNDKLGPWGAYCKLLSTWSKSESQNGRGMSARQIAEKTKLFFTKYAINRHKMTVLTPSLHMEQYSPDDNVSGLLWAVGLGGANRRGSGSICGRFCIRGLIGRMRRLIGMWSGGRRLRGGRKGQSRMRRSIERGNELGGRLLSVLQVELNLGLSIQYAQGAERSDHAALARMGTLRAPLPCHD